jgi:hypothetical protein
MAPYGYAPPSNGKKTTETKAVLSLFLGLASFVFGPATGIPAIILGSVSRRDIDQSSGRYGGALIARAGTLAGFFGVGFFVVFVLWLGSAIITPPNEGVAEAHQVSGMSGNPTQSEAKVVKSAPQASHPRGDVEPFHSIR